MDQLTTAMAEAARLAPSMHNSQPWRFLAGRNRFEVLLDPSRSTPAIDPVGRSMWLACGAAVVNARVTAGAAGRACSMTFGPTRERPDLVAVLSLDGPARVLDEDLELARAVSRRHSVRTSFDPVPVPPELVRRLREAVEREHAWLAVVSRPEEVIELAILSGHAEAVATADEAYRDELSSWLRAAGQDAADGIPVPVVSGENAAGARVVPLRAFVHRDEDLALGPDTPAPPVERPLLAVVGTDGDREVDWTRAGMAMQRLWLTATAAGLVASPMTQALDHAAFRARLSSIVGLEYGHPQMLLRVGYGDLRVTTGRRTLSDVLVREPEAMAKVVAERDFRP